jgi:hypothetical protein
MARRSVLFSPGDQPSLMRAMGGTTGGRLLTVVGNTVSLFKIRIEIKSDTNGFIELLIERRNSYHSSRCSDTVGCTYVKQSCPKNVVLDDNPPGYRRGIFNELHRQYEQYAR